MAELGKINQLRVNREAPQGLYLDAGELGEVLLPNRYVTGHPYPGEFLRVFLYRDSEDRLVATTERPIACVDEFAALDVISVQPGMGAFLDWGLSKDLLLPMREQSGELAPGDRVVVRVQLDPGSNRIVATTKIEHFLRTEAPDFGEGQRVKLLIARETPLGFQAIVENEYAGLLYKTDLASPLSIGQRMFGFVRKIRPDGKIDLALDRAGYSRVAPLGDQIVKILERRGGFIPLTDQSSPEEIRETFGASKKAFKQAIGALYKQRRVRIEEGGIRLICLRPN